MLMIIGTSYILPTVIFSAEDGKSLICPYDVPTLYTRKVMDGGIGTRWNRKKEIADPQTKLK